MISLYCDSKKKNVSDSFTELKTLKIYSLCCLKKDRKYISV